MTTTSTQVGISGDEKPTSRVLRPPGGASSNIFGGSDDGPRNAQRQQPISNVFGGEANEPPQKTKPQQQATHSNIFGEQQQESPSAPQQKQKPQGAYNPITGEPVGNAASNGDGDTKKVHTSSRVLNPPGGKSTALW